MIEIYKEVGRPSCSPGSSTSPTCRARTRSATRAWPPWRSPPRGPFVLHGLDLCLVHTGRSRTTTGFGATSGGRGSSSRRRTTPRSRPAISPGACAREPPPAGARGLPRRPRRLLHLCRWHCGRLRCALARPDRLQAGRARRATDCGGDGLGVPRDRGSPRGAMLACGSPSRHRLRVGEGARLMATALGDEVVDLAVTPLRELNQRLHDVARTGSGPRRWRIVNPRGAHAVACGLDAELDVEIDGHVGVLLRRDEPACDGACQAATPAGVADMMLGSVVVAGSVSQLRARPGSWRAARRDLRLRAAASRMKGVDRPPSCAAPSAT